MRQANQQHGSEPALSLRPWQRLSVKLACLLATVTACAVAAVDGLIPRSPAYLRIRRELLTIRNEVLLTNPICTHMTSTSDADAERLEALLR